MSRDREYHDDGSYTDRYDDLHHTSITFEPDGEVRETSIRESCMPFSFLLPVDDDIVVTRDKEGNVINTQSL